MASLDLKMEGFTGNPKPWAKRSTMSTLKSKFCNTSTAYKPSGTSSYSDDRVFVILRDFLQPATTISLESAAHSILALLPEDAPLSEELSAFGDVCLELAEQIPYYHPSQLKFARLLEYIGRSTKVTDIFTSNGQSKFYNVYQRFAESIRESVNAYENPSEYVNVNAFWANLGECHIWQGDPTYSVWMLRSAFEESHDKEDNSDRDCRILVAAQWILWNGQNLFKHVLYPGDDVSSDAPRKWTPGPSYNADRKLLLSLPRWHFWKDGFKAVTTDGRSGYSDECRNLARKAADLMDAFEKSMMP